MTETWKRWLDFHDHRPTDKIMSELAKNGNAMTSAKRWKELASIVDDRFGKDMGIVAQFSDPNDSYPEGVLSINIVYAYANIFPQLKGATKIWYNDIAAMAFGFDPM